METSIKYLLCLITLFLLHRHSSSFPSLGCAPILLLSWWLTLGCTVYTSPFSPGLCWNSMEFWPWCSLRDANDRYTTITRQALSLHVWLCEPDRHCRCLSGWRSLAIFEDWSLIPGAGKNNVLVSRSDWQTLVSSVCNDSLVSASADRYIKPGSQCCGLQYTARHNREMKQQGHIFHSHDGGTYTVSNHWVLVRLGKLRTQWRRYQFSYRNAAAICAFYSNIEQRLPTHYADHSPAEWTVC